MAGRRKRSPELVQMKAIHTTAQLKALGVATSRDLKQATRDIRTTDRTRARTPPVVSGYHDDGSALQSMLNAQVKAGLIIDKSETSATYPALHTHDFAAMVFVNENRGFTATAAITTDVEVDTFNLALVSGVTYNIVASAVFEGYAAGGATAEVQLGIQIDGGAVAWGSVSSSENESAPVSASDKRIGFAATGTIAISIRARRSSGTGDCFIRAGHSYAWALPAMTLGVA